MADVVPPSTKERTPAPSSTSSSSRPSGTSSSSSSSRPSRDDVSSNSSSHANGKSSSSSSTMSSAERAARDEAAKRRRAPPGSDATPEERAKYELERKKVAKYKEDKLRARRDHTRMILESHAQAKRRALLGKQSEFLATLEFRNALPDLPFETKFLTYPHESERLIKYKPNTLEADYTYAIHEEANLGLNIELIDPAKYEAPLHPSKLEIGDEQALMMKEESAKSGRVKARPAVPWLRRTEYMGTDLYDAVHKFKSEVEIQSALRKGTETALGEEYEITVQDRAEASFRDIQDAATLVHPFNKQRKIAKVWDVLPDAVLSANKYAILSYDILPSTDIKSKTIKDREARALLSGVSKKGTSDAIQGSILLPTATTDDDKETSDAEKFAYFREYLMSVESLESTESQHTVFMLDPTSDTFTYSDILHRIQLKKTRLTSEDKRRRGAIVHRRAFSQGEQERRDALCVAYGGLYDDDLDGDTEIRAFKRRRQRERKDASGLNQVAEEEQEDDSNVDEETKASGSPVGIETVNETVNETIVEETVDETIVETTNAVGSASPAISDGSDSSSSSSGSSSDSE